MANTSEISKLCPLPRDKKRLRQFNNILDSKNNKVFIGNEFTETNLKKLNKISSTCSFICYTWSFKWRFWDLNQSALVSSHSGKPTNVMMDY